MCRCVPNTLLRDWIRVKVINEEFFIAKDRYVYDGCSLNWPLFRVFNVKCASFVWLGNSSKIFLTFAVECESWDFRKNQIVFESGWRNGEIDELRNFKNVWSDLVIFRILSPRAFSLRFLKKNYEILEFRSNWKKKNVLKLFEISQKSKSILKINKLSWNIFKEFSIFFLI